MADSLAGFANKLDRIADAIAGPALKRTLDKVGAQGKRDINTAVSATLGDQSMSNWRRGKPIQITGRYNLRTDTALEILPVKRASGPMRVLESGRSAGTSRKGRRYGASSGKGTWSRATQTMEKSLPRVAAAAVHDALTKIF